MFFALYATVIFIYNGTTSIYSWTISIVAVFMSIYDTVNGLYSNVHLFCFKLTVVYVAVVSLYDVVTSLCHCFLHYMERLNVYIIGLLKYMVV